MINITELGFNSGLTVKADEIFDKYIDTALPLCVYDFSGQFLCSDLKLYLMRFYDDETAILYFCPSKNIFDKQIALYELDRQDCDNSSYIILSAQNVKKRYGFGDLLRIIKRLTAEDGCQWDKAQTHQSIRVNMLEEAYEAVEAIDNNDIEAMIEEFGDVLLQSILHSDIAVRAGEFDESDVLSVLCNKLITRHTHIFGLDKAQDEKQALNFWEKAKQLEKGHKDLKQEIEAIPQTFSALLKASKLIKKLKKNGSGDEFDGADLKAKNAIDNNDIAKALYYVIALAVQNGVDAEIELLDLISKRIKDVCN